MSEAQIPENLKYTESHEWVKIQGDTYTMGITDYAQGALGDIVFVELPAVGAHFDKGQAVGVVESIKSVSDIYAPVGGEVVGHNEELSNNPEQCNKDPYGSWIIKVKMQSPNEAAQLMDYQQYKAFCSASA